MRTTLAPIVVLALLSWACAGQETKEPGKVESGKVTAHSGGLHGYIGFSAARPPARSAFSAGMGFYSAVWPLIDQPLADFQIGLAGSWITPDNSDNKDTALAPEGTLARTWRERGPTWESVFQTVEGGLGYWAGNHFRYGPPKFSMNATPQCYDYEVGSPGWSFFYSNQALPDNRLGIAQLSNRLLIPPDAPPFQGNPNGQFLGYAWMALPFTEPTQGDPPTGDQSWTCFLSAANFKGPIAYYIPETWSKIGKLFKYPFVYGRGLDARPGNMGGGAMEINTVPRFDSRDAQGRAYSKIPSLRRRSCSRRSSNWPGGVSLTVRRPPAPGLAPARNSGRSPSSSPMVLWLPTRGTGSWISRPSSNMIGARRRRRSCRPLWRSSTRPGRLTVTTWRLPAMGPW